MSLTRERILELGEGLILTKGYNAFSYQDISRELGIKNAAIHYYFPSKENLGTSIIKNNILRFEEMIDNMNTREFNEQHQLESFLKLYSKSNRENKICLIGSLGPDFNTLSETSKIELKKMSGKITDWLTSVLENGRKKKLFKFIGEAKVRALLILATLVAGLQLGRVFDKSEFKSIYSQIIEDLKP